MEKLTNPTALDKMAEEYLSRLDPGFWPEENETSVTIDAFIAGFKAHESLAAGMIETLEGFLLASVHLDTCSFSLTGDKCDCFVGKSREALLEYERATQGDEK